MADAFRRGDRNRVCLPKLERSTSSSPILPGTPLTESVSPYPRPWTRCAGCAWSQCRGPRPMVDAAPRVEADERVDAAVKYSPRSESARMRGRKCCSNL